MAEPALVSAGDSFEAQLPEGQRWVNRFCENWIFAFLVAMVIRHYVIEAFTIPTASMEPMLYGEKGFLNGDHVVVDKLLCRFRKPHRWDVTVFQFPEPEIEFKDTGQPAIDSDGNQISSWPLQPLMYRNFVKRLVAMPGDVFYLAHGQLHLRNPDGSFSIARKPPAIQEALWQEVYRAGAQPSYTPWDPASAVAAHDAVLDVTIPSTGQVLFTQPFRNLYLKPGQAGVKRLPGGTLENVEVSMLQPQFIYPADQQVGNIWDLDQWGVYRRTLEDLDNEVYGTDLSSADNEWVGDVRVQATITRISGHPALILRHGSQQGVQLVISDDGWRLEGLDGLAKGHPLASGGEVLTGHRVTLEHLDDECIVAMDERELLRFAVPEVDPDLQRTSFAIAGSGELELTGLHIQRDLHYTSNFVLKNEATDLANYQNSIPNIADAVQKNKASSQVRDVTRVRRQFGAPLGSVGPWGDSPEHAVTVPAGCYLMLGDNSPTSWDGRAWGFVPAENLRGRALAVVLPFTRWRMVR